MRTKDQPEILGEHRSSRNEHVVELRRFLRERDYEESDPTPLEEAIIEGIAALEACDRAEHYVPTSPPLAQFSENDIRALFEILRYTQREPHRLEGILRLLRDQPSSGGALRADGSSTT